QMYEDIEVMRRLLLRTVPAVHMSKSCMSCHSAVPHALAFSPDGRLLAGEMPGSGVRLWDAVTGRQILPAAHPPIPDGGVVGPDIEGVYLNGYGVVFSLTLPPQPVAGGWVLPDTQAKPVSDWEKVRRQVRGEKPSLTGGPPKGKEPRLDE